MAYHIYSYYCAEYNTVEFLGRFLSLMGRTSFSPVDYDDIQVKTRTKMLSPDTQISEHGPVYEPHGNCTDSARTTCVAAQERRGTDDSIESDDAHL